MGDVIVEIVQIVLPALLVLTGMIVVLNNLNQREARKERAELRTVSLSRLIPLRLQAYERCVLFLERISPENLLLRVEGGGKDARLFLMQMQVEIRSEFEHNYSQQLYISDNGWKHVVRSKDYILALLNRSMTELPANATGIDLGKRVLQNAMDDGATPTHEGIRVLKAELNKALLVQTA